MPDTKNDPKERASASTADALSAANTSAASADNEPQTRPFTIADLRRMRDSVSPADIARYDDHYKNIAERQDYEALLPIFRRLIAAHD